MVEFHGENRVIQRAGRHREPEHWAFSSCNETLLGAAVNGAPSTSFGAEMCPLYGHSKAILLDDMPMTWLIICP